MQYDRFAVFKIRTYLTEVTTGGESDEFFLDIKDPEIVALDKVKGDLTALREGETTVSHVIVLMTYTA